MPISMCLVLNVIVIMVETLINIMIMAATLSKIVNMHNVMVTDVHVVMVST